MEQKQLKIINNFNLTNYNAYRIKAICSKAWFPENETDLLAIFNQKKNNRLIILGNGNNIILSKEHYDEEFIILNGCFDKVIVSNAEIEAEAGATLLQLSETALKHSLTGLEIFYDIPSSVGGAVFMNAGANGEEISDLLTRVRYLDLTDFEIKDRLSEELEFEYRNSYFQKKPDKIVLRAWLRLAPGNYNTIKDKMETNRQNRWAKQPRDYPNCGSVFKRPAGRYVGPMIDELGLKGFTIGGAQISRKHSGFIVNIRNATVKTLSP
jgi:UDP-N-acetylmuramate dehydrogenase